MTPAPSSAAVARTAAPTVQKQAVPTTTAPVVQQETQLPLPPPAGRGRGAGGRGGGGGRGARGGGGGGGGGGVVEKPREVRHELTKGSNVQAANDIKVGESVIIHKLSPGVVADVVVCCQPFFAHHKILH